jgi:ABC-type branched-subunit amino acid transport system permease subunit
MALHAGRRACDAALVAVAIGRLRSSSGGTTWPWPLAFGIIVNIVFREEMRWTGGPDGMVGIPGLALFGIALDSITKYYYLVWAVVAVAFLFTINLIQSPVGRALRAIHTSEPAASAMGIPSRTTR